MATPTASPERPTIAEMESVSLTHGLEGVSRRIRLLRGIRWAARGVIAGSVAALCLLALSRFGLLPLFLDLSLPFLIGAIYLLSIGLGLLLAFRKAVDALSLARYAEQRLDLKERLSSAMMLGSRSDVLGRLLRDDASRYADRIEPRLLIPWRLTWELPAAMISLLIVLLAALPPQSPLSVTSPGRTARAVTASEGKKLEEVARQVLRQSDQAAPPPVKDAARRLQQVARAMQHGQATPSQAIHDLQQLSDQIKKANRQAAGASGKPGMDGVERSAQARTAAQQELDRDLHDTKGGNAQGAPRQAGNSSQSGGNSSQSGGNSSQSGGNSSQSGGNSSQSGGNSSQSDSNASQRTKSLGPDKPDASSGHASPGHRSSPAGKPAAEQTQTNAPNGQKPPAKAAQGHESSNPGTPRTTGTGSSSSAPGKITPPGKTAQPSSAPGKPDAASGKPDASTGKQMTGAKSSGDTQGASPKKLDSPKTGKDFGKSAPTSSNPKSSKPAISGETLGDKLRRYADKVAERKMATGEQEQAAGSLDKLNQKLDGAQMPQTQSHVQAAAQALREGRQQDAVSELRNAADAADRETPVTEQKSSPSSSSAPPSSSSSEGGGQSQNGASQQMQRAIDKSKQNLSSQGDPQGRGQQSGQSNSGRQGAGNSQRQNPGQSQDGKDRSSQKDNGAPGNTPSSGSGRLTPEGAKQPHGDTAHVTGGKGPAARQGTSPTPGFPMTTPGSGKVVLKPLSSGGRMIERPVPGKETPGAALSTVPYYQVSPQFKKAAERDAGSENIPPAYRQQIKKYFDSLTPHK